MADCVSDKKNIGKSKCTRLPSLPKYIITTPNGFELTDANLATPTALKEALQAALKASKSTRIYLWPKFSSFEDQSEEAIYVQTPLGSRKVRDGQYRFRFGVSKDLCTHKAMFSHSSFGEGRVIIVDFNNRLLVTKASNGNYRGLSMDLLNAEKLRMGDGSNITESPIYLSLNDNLELDQSGELLDAGTVITELEPLTDVELKLTATATATTLVVSVKNVCDGEGVAGLVLADFIIRNAAGVVVAPTTVVDAASNGVYTITRTPNFVAGAYTVTLRDSSTLSLSAYEVLAPLAVTIP